MPVKTECASCFIAVRVNLDTGEVTARIPSNGKRGALYVAPHTATTQGTLDADQTLLLWECPACGYADSTYVDPEVREALS
jgi:hypothetical protein